MAKCAYCETETFIFDGGVPLGIHCAQERDSKRKSPATAQEIRTELLHDLLGATAHSREAARLFDEAIGQFPSGLPHPDGAQLVKNASNKLSIARKEMGTAHNRLNDYLSRGVLPDDLKQSG
jgi:hypothetical protein